MRIALLAIVTSMLLIQFAPAQTVVDPNLRVDLYVKGLDNPTGIAFLPGSSDAMITQKNDGKVLLLHDRKITGTALDLPVANNSEEGLLSIALSPTFTSDHLVYLYHTVASKDGGTAVENQISRYIWNGKSLKLDRNIINLPVTPGPNHNGGKIMFGPKGKLYAVIGDLNQQGQTQNFENSSQLDLAGVMIRINPDGSKISTNPFATGGARNAKDDIFAYGIRNSFGIAFDPITNLLWDTENGPDRMDEINQVNAGFNSGWRDIMGPVSRNGGAGTLVNLGPKAKYSDPQFSWSSTVAPTDLTFFTGQRLGADYENDMFIGDVNTGTLFDFDLSSDRKSLDLTGSLADKVADNSAGDLLGEQDSIVFGNGFGTVTDLLNGPGGLFALSLDKGKLYRIRENESPSALPDNLSAMSMTLLPEPGIGLIALMLLLPATRRRIRA